LTSHLKVTPMIDPESTFWHPPYALHYSIYLPA